MKEIIFVHGDEAAMTEWLKTADVLRYEHDYEKGIYKINYQ